MTGQALVAGVGNIFLSDDGFGSEVARRLQREPLPARVRVVDYGIRGVHLAYDLLDGYDTLVIVDTIGHGDHAGDVTVLDVDPSGLGAGWLDAHALDPAAVLATVASLGGTIPRTFVVGCRPETVDEGMGLSTPVAAAVDTAIDEIADLLALPR